MFSQWSYSGTWWLQAEIIGITLCDVLKIITLVKDGILYGRYIIIIIIIIIIYKR